MPTSTRASQRTGNVVLLAGVLCLGAAAGCAGAARLNFLEPGGPRYAGSFRPGTSLDALRAADNGDSRSPVESHPDTFLVASFNIKLGKDPHNALKTLRRSGLDRADVLLLQEVDRAATELIAESLQLHYVYYPANVHPVSHRMFGVAILSPWPIRDDRKIVLTNFLDARDPGAKVAAVATVEVRGVSIGVINVHLQLGLSAEQTHDQMREVVDCAFSEECDHPEAPLLPAMDHIVLAGDLNTARDHQMKAADGVLASAGLRRVPDIGRTFKYMMFGLAKLDHIYADPTLMVEESGEVEGFFATGSDHFPIWARLRLPSS